jgi:hypothetical protein
MGASKSSPKQTPQDSQNGPDTPRTQRARFAVSDDDPVFHQESHAASAEDLDWMNYMLHVMWSHIRSTMIKKANEKFDEKMGEELSKHPEIRVDDLTLEFDPGNKPPRLTGLVCYQRTQQERNGLQMDWDFVWRPDSDFHARMTMHGYAKMIAINAENFGVQEMTISGTLSCLLAPLLDVEPCVGTGQIFFLDAPYINMKMTGVKKYGPMAKVLTNIIQGVVSNVLAEGYILPHRFVQRVRKDLPLEQMVTMKSPLPLGLLQVEVLEGRNLPASDTSLVGKKSSDPFVKVKVGFGEVRTSTVSNTIHPKWNDPAGNLFVYNVAQLVRITVHDDDVMGDDVLCTVVGYNVFLLCMEAEKVAKENKGVAGMWLNLHDEDGKPAGQLKIAVRYYDVADLEVKQEVPKLPITPAPNAPPYLLTVKLLGLEAEDRGDLRNTRATVEVVYPPGYEDDQKVDHHEHHANRLMAGLEAATKWVGSKVKAATGLGFGHRQDGVPKKRKTVKAALWGEQASSKVQDAQHKSVPPMAIRAMERMYIREGMPLEKVANMFQLPMDVVKAAVEMRGNFEVVWHEALHFLQPASNPFLGKIQVSVEAPAINQVRGADDHGFIGSFEIDLAPDAPEAVGGENSPYRRRIRRMMYRDKVKGKKEDIFEKKESSVAEAGTETEQGGESHNNQESTGILIELVVEVRHLKADTCALDTGQSLRSREQIVASSAHSGVRMTPE